MNQRLRLGFALVVSGFVAGCNCGRPQQQEPDPLEPQCPATCPSGQSCNPQTKVCEAVVDRTAPETTIVEGPAGLTDAGTATFTFSASETPATFTCRVDGVAMAPCTSPATVTVADGEHRFEVAAADQAGNVDPTPASRTWRVDTVPPTVTIASPANGASGAPDVVLTFSASEPAALSCTVDGAAPAPCTSPRSLTGLGVGSHQLSVQATDEAGNTGVAAVTYTVIAGPSITGPADVATDEDTATPPIAFAVSDPDTALDTLLLTVTSSDETLFPAGSLVLGGSGGARTLVATPAPQRTGVATITLTVSDGASSAQATFTITVREVNDPPTISAVGNQALARDTTSGPIAFTVSDGETPAAALVVMASSTNVGLLPLARITLGGAGASRTVVLAPAAGEVGTSTVTLTVSDGTASASTSFLLTVGGTEQPPTISAIPDQTTPEDTPVGPVAFTVADADTPVGSLVLSAAVADPVLLPPAGISLGGSGASRTITLVPAANRSGSTTVSVTVTDGVGSATRTFTVVVQPVNDLPTISAVADQTITEGGSTAVLPFTVSDVETAAASLTVTASSSNTALIPTASVVLGGSGANRTVRVTGAPQQFGASTITLTVSDGTATRSTTFQVTVTAVNDGPTITAPASLTIDEDGTTGPLAFTVADPDTPLASLSVVASSSDMGLVPEAPANLSLGGSGGSRTVTVKPLADRSGAVTITLTVSDGTLQAQATFTVTVRPVNDVPVMNALVDRSTPEDTPADVAVSVTDADVGETGTFTASSDTPGVVAAAGLALTGTGLSRTLTITPVANASGSTRITVRFTDAAGAFAERSFTLTVTPVNDPPLMALIAAQSTAEDTPRDVTVSVTDPDDSTGTFTASSATPTIVPSTQGAPGWSYSGTGLGRTLTLTPLPNAFGATEITATFTDGAGATASRTFTLTVTPVNDAPTITDISNQSTQEDVPRGPLAFTVGDAETAPGSLTLTRQSSNTTVLPLSGITFGGSGADRTVTLTPAADQTGTSTVTITVSDGTLTDSTTFVLTVGGVNDAPTITPPGNTTVDEDVSTGALAFTVGDTDTPVTSLTVTASSSDQTLVPDGNITLGGSGAGRTVAVLPATNRSGGPVTITLTVSDGIASTTATFTVTVRPVNDRPTISAIAAQVTDEGTPRGPIAFTVDDVETAPSSLTVTASQTNPGLLSIGLAGTGGNRTVTLTPQGDLSGTSDVTLTVSDGNLSAATTFTVTVRPVNDLPVITSPGNRTILEDTPGGPYSFTVSDVETPATSLVVSAASSDTTLVPDGGLVLGGDGGTRTVSITPGINGSGAATITLSVSDGTAAVSTTFGLTVTPVNDPPVIDRIADVTTDEDVPAAVAVTVTDPDDTTATFTASSSDTAVVASGGLSFAGTGLSRILTITPVANASGFADITVSAFDGDATHTRTFRVTVRPVNDPPVMTAITAKTTAEDVAIDVTVTVTDVDDLTGTFTASSGNPALVPDAQGTPGWTYSGTNLVRTLRLTPLANATGNTSITARFADAAGAVTSSTFTLTVTPVNDRPTLTDIANVTSTVAGAAVSVSTTLADVEDTDEATHALGVSPADTLLFPAGNIAVSTGSATRTITLTPAAGRGGVTSVNVTYTDSGGLSASKSFTATIAVRASVSSSGPGTAAITSCGRVSPCDVLPGAQLTYVATPSPGAAFVEWTGDCAGQGAAATVVAGSTWVSCTATFRGRWAMTYDPPGSQGTPRNTAAQGIVAGRALTRFLTTADVTNLKVTGTASLLDIDPGDGSFLRGTALTELEASGAEGALTPVHLAEPRGGGGTVALVRTSSARVGLVWVDDGQTITRALRYTADQSEMTPTALIALADKGFAFTEVIPAVGSEPVKGRVVRLNADGSIAWSQSFCDRLPVSGQCASSSCAHTFPFRLTELPDGALIIVSFAYYPGDPWAYHLVVSRFEPTGALGWHRHLYLDQPTVNVFGIAITAIGGEEVLISGYTYSLQNRFVADMFVMRAAAGRAGFVPAWTTRLGDAATTEAGGEALLGPSGTVVLTGWAERGKRVADVTAVELDTAGKAVRGMAYGAFGEDVGFFIRPEPLGLGGYLLLGSATSFNAGQANVPWALTIGDALDIAFNASPGAAAESYLPTSTAAVPQTVSSCQQLESSPPVSVGSLNARQHRLDAATARQAP